MAVDTAAKRRAAFGFNCMPNLGGVTPGSSGATTRANGLWSYLAGTAATPSISIPNPSAQWTLEDPGLVFLLEDPGLSFGLEDTGPF